MALKVNPVTLTLYSSPEGRYHHPLNPLNLLNPLNPHAAGVSKGEAALFPLALLWYNGMV